MSAIEYYLQNHPQRTPLYFQADFPPTNHLTEHMGLSLPDRKMMGGVEVGDVNKDGTDESLSDNMVLLKTLDSNDIAPGNNNNNFSNNFNNNFNNNNDFNYPSYNKSMFGFSSYDYKSDTSLLISAPPPSTTTTTPFFNHPDHYFSPPLFLPYNDAQDKIKKRSPTITKKERRRTHSINAAFSALRNCIPNVPSDTKLSKIKTLRLATSYIAFLMNVLDKNDPKLAEMGFKADMSSSRRNENREEKRRRETQEILKASMKQAEKQPRGRTGWPQQVWASELK